MRLRPKVLLVSPDYPPLGAPQAYQSLRLAKALNENGMDVTVVAAELPQTRRDCQHLESPDIEPCVDIKVLRYRPFRLPDGIARAYRLFHPEDVGCNLYPLRNLLRNLLRRCAFDHVISIAEPLVTHRAVEGVARGFPNMDMVYWFSDPVALPENVEMMRFEWRRRRCAAICSNALKRAIAVVGVTREILEPLEVFRRSATKRFCFVHSFDPDEWCNCNLATNDRRSRTFRIVHTGALYWRRHPRALLEGAIDFCRQHPEVELEVVLQGGIARAIMDEIAAFTFPFRLTLTGPVSYERSKDMMLTADALCIIDVDWDVNIHLPSKVADYVAAKKPIIYIGARASPTMRELVIHPAAYQGRTRQEISEAIRKISCIANDKPNLDYSAVYNKFSLRNVYSPLIKLLLERYEHHRTC